MNILKSNFPTFSLLILLVVSIFVTSCKQDALNNEVIEPATSPLDQQFSKYQIVEIDNEKVWRTIKNQRNGTVNLEMRDATSNDEVAKWSFNMQRIQVKAEDFTMNLSGKDGQVTQIQLPETHVLTGQLTDGTGEIFLGLSRENLRAEIVDDNVAYMIEPLSEYIKNAKPNEYIKYNVADVVTEGEFTCGFDQSKFEVTTTEGRERPSDERAANCLKVEIMYVGDFALFQRFGNDFNAASNWMFWRVVYGGYRYYRYNNFQLNFVIKQGWLYNWPAQIAGPRNSYPLDYCTEIIVNQWKNFANNNANWIKRGDANILFTGLNNCSNRVGGALTKSICNGYNWQQAPYCWVEYQTNSYHANNTTAHEVGHILGAGHSPTGFMTENVGNGSHTMHWQTRNELNGWVWGHSNCLGWEGCVY